MKESRSIVRDEKPLLPGWQSHRNYRHASSEHERQTYLILKIQEEVQEVVEAHNSNNRNAVLEELSDVYELILCLDKPRDLFCMYQPNMQSILDTYQFSQEDIVEAAEQKRKTHGSFKAGILLDSNTV